MRLAVVAPFPPNPQGEANYTGRFVRALMAESPDRQIAIFAHRQSGSADVEELAANVRVHRILDPRSYWARQIGCWRLFRAIRGFRPDVLHLQGGLLPDYGGRFGEPLVLLMFLLRLYGIRLVVTVHSTWRLQDVYELGRKAGLPPLLARIVRSYYRMLLRSFYRQFHSVNLLVSGHEPPIVAQYIAEYGLDRSKIAFEPHPCRYQSTPNEVRESAKQTLGLAGRRVVVAAGFMRPDKGYHLLLEAADTILEKNPGAAILIAGTDRGRSPGYLDRLRALHKKCVYASRVHLKLAYLTDEELGRAWQAADAVVIPYLRSIGASGPVHHAFSRGRAVVASEDGQNLGLRDLCVLVPVNDTVALGKAISSLLDDTPRRLDLEQRSAKYAQAHSWDGLARSFRAHYDLLLKGRSAATPHFRCECGYKPKEV